MASSSAVTKFWLIFDYDFVRVVLKETVGVVNHFTGEGIYTCHVSNIRGGGVRIKRKSEPAIVLVPILRLTVLVNAIKKPCIVLKSRWSNRYRILWQPSLSTNRAGRSFGRSGPFIRHCTVHLGVAGKSTNT